MIPQPGPGGLFSRHPDNPILTAADWPYFVHTVFNPGAVRLKDGSTLLLCRVEDHTGHSHLCVARSKNGLDSWTIDPKPTFLADPELHPEELWGVEDPRITYMEDIERYAIVYTAFTRDGPGVAMALTEDFVNFERSGLVMQPDDKDAALLPKRIGNQYALVHRPATEVGGNIWVSFSPDLSNWGHHTLMLAARKGAWWDANKIGLSPPLIETERGWLMLYHGVRETVAGDIYRVGLALFSLENPAHCLLRSKPWAFGPEAPYEKSGDVNNVVFPCGTTIKDDGDTLHLYYGAADTCIGVATASLRELLGWLDTHGSGPLP